MEVRRAKKISLTELKKKTVPLIEVYFFVE